MPVTEQSATCTCGAQEELERLRDIVESLRHLAASAEVIVIRGTSTDYKPRVVYAQDLEAVLDGRLSV